MKPKIDKKQVLRLFKSGRKMEDIARLLECSRTRIWKIVMEDIESVVEIISRMGYSGGSIRYFMDILTKIISREPLTPLTGKLDEWVFVTNGVYQNKRCSRVFAEGVDGLGAFDIEGKVFVSLEGVVYTNNSSKVPVSFPYTPKTEFIKVPPAIVFTEEVLNTPVVYPDEYAVGVVESYATHLRNEEIAKEKAAEVL